MVQPKQEQLVARRIGSIELGMHARPEYLERHGRPRRPEDLAAHALIGYDQPSAWVRQAEKSLGGIRREMFHLRTDSNVAQLALIRAGAGLGMCQVPLARRDGLVRVLPMIRLPLETWVTMHEDLRASPRCRVAFDALAEGLASYLAA